MRINKNILKIKAVVLLSIFVIGIIFASGLAQESEEKSTTEVTTTTTTTIKVELTAREALSIVEILVRDWASDAVLVDLTNFRGTSLSDGRAVRWKLEFNSESVKKELEVHVSRGKILQKMEEKYKKRDVITGEWIDTPKVMDVALKYFDDERPIKNYWLGIGNNEGTIIWYVKCAYDEGVPTWVHVNALTGEFIKTSEGY